MFKKKTKPEPEPFVPKYYVKVYYAEDASATTKVYENKEDALMAKEAIIWNAEHERWVEVGPTTINANKISSIRIMETSPLRFRDLGWG